MMDAAILKVTPGGAVMPWGPAFTDPNAMGALHCLCMSMGWLSRTGILPPFLVCHASIHRHLPTPRSPQAPFFIAHAPNGSFWVGQNTDTGFAMYLLDSSGAQLASYTFNDVELTGMASNTDADGRAYIVENSYMVQRVDQAGAWW
jgi:hypothetical protein